MKRLCMVLALLFAPAAGAAFKCVDAQGKTHVGDTVPDACANVPVYETSRTGSVLRKIDPTPSAEEVKQRREVEEKRRALEREAADQKRKDEALLSSFSNEREFDVTRDRNIEPLRGRIVNGEDRLKAIDKREAEIDNEMEFYKAGKGKAGKGREPPAMLVAEKERLHAERQAIQRSISGFNREIEQLKVKFDTDKKRWVALKNGGGKVKPTVEAAVEPAKAAAEPSKPVVKKN